MSLKVILNSISSISEFFGKNETILRTLDADQRSKFIFSVQEALSRILKALSVANLTLDECAQQAVEGTSLTLMLPMCRSIASSFDRLLVEEWISWLVPKVHVAPVSLQPAMLQVVCSLFSFVQVISLSGLRNKFGIDLGGSLKTLANALLCEFFVPVQLVAFGGVNLPTWNVCASMQVSLQRLTVQVMESCHNFVVDLLGDAWFAACCGLNTVGWPLLHTSSVKLLVQLGLHHPFPCVVEDSFLRGVCDSLQSKRGTVRALEFDDALASCLDLCLSQVGVLSLHAASDVFFSFIVSAVRETSSERLQGALLRAFRIFNDSLRTNNVVLLMSLCTLLDHQSELANCLANGSVRQTLRDALSAAVFSPSFDSVALLSHTRMILLVARVFFDQREESAAAKADAALAVSKVSSLFLTLKAKVRPRDVSAWARHLGLVFRFATHFGSQIPVLLGKDCCESLNALLFGGFTTSSPGSEDVLGVEARMSWIVALGVVSGLSCGKVKDALMGCVIRQPNQELFDRSVKTLALWLSSTRDDKAPALAVQIALELLSESGNGQILRVRGDSLVRTSGLCVCTAAGCFSMRAAGGKACCSKIVVPWKHWSVLFDILNSKAAEPCMLAASLDALSRLLRHIGPNVEEVGTILEQLVFPYCCHEAPSVRVAFAELFVPSLCSAFPRLVGALEKTLMSRFSVVSPSTQASILSALAKVAIFEDAPDSELFIGAFYALIRSFHHRDLEVRAAAYDGVREVARARRLSEAQLFSRHEDEIFSLLVKQLSQEPALLEEVAMFLDQTPIELLKRTLPNWLPKLCSEPAKQVLEEVAVWLGVSLSELLTAHCVSVCLHILLEDPGFETASTFLTEATGEQLDELMDSWMHDLMRELVVMMGESEAADRFKCERGINTLALARLRRKDPARIKRLSEGEMADFISGCFLAIMEHLDNMLLPSNSNLAERRSAILGFDQLVALMARGNSAHLVSLRPKIMATLKLALKLPDLQLEACSVFRRFLDRLGINNIGPILGQIVVDLLPYIAQETAPQVSGLVVSILEWLIVKNGDALSKHFRDVHFLPDVPALARVRGALEKRGGGVASLDELLEQLTIGLQYESIDVRLMAVKKLIWVLRNHRKDVDWRILQRQRVAPIIEHLLPHLLSGSKGMASVEAKGLYAACLGLLGAIDPGRVDLRLRLEFQSQWEDTDLAIELLNNHLVPALEEARNTETQGSAAFGRAAFAIQELLKFCGCGIDTPGKAGVPDVDLRARDRKKKDGVQVWNKLTAKSQAIVRPYLASCYQLTDESAPPPRSGTYYGIYVQFRRWVGNFAAFLISRVHGPSSALFTACRSSVKDHDHIARFLLPYLILRLASSKKECEMIQQEMHAVLLAEAAKSADMSQLCTQTVFHTIDVLVHWVEEKRKSIAPGAAKTNKRAKTSSVNGDDDLSLRLPADYAAVCDLLASIPQLMIAKAALRCGAFARALKAVEAHVREEQAGKDDAGKKEVLIRVVSQLQQIFGGLEGFFFFFFFFVCHFFF
jgi:hypothetical protein